MTAARLLRKQLGVVDGSIDNLETKNLNKIIQERIDEVKLDVNTYVNKQVSDLLLRIEALENRLKTTRRTTSKVSSKDVEI
ncbi:hypothetical protein NIES3806_41820 [Microcystis aeruginosa NIES-3806]|nr:hypothetical protein NIES3806_41820 [Microcystis aeruginosa NIES-3806]